MTLLNGSLRARLLILILVPLIVVSMVAVYLRFESARKTAEDIFDRNLMMLCLAVSRDVANSGGDSLSQTTVNLLKNASGGDLYYHVYGPDGSFVTGYSSPPVVRDANSLNFDIPIVFDATHLGRTVRAARLAENVLIGGISGTSVVTVWQPLEPRQAFARRMASQAGILTGLIVLSVAGLVFFGVRFGLRPLQDLEAAITKRSNLDLRPIERRIPFEAQGIVARLNDLFFQLNEANRSKDNLISNTAHQLRNPIAAMHSMAYAIAHAKNETDTKERADELLGEIRRVARLTDQMLSYERIKGVEHKLRLIDLHSVLPSIIEPAALKTMQHDVTFEFLPDDAQAFVEIDDILIQEAIYNLVANALDHGGQQLTMITLRTKVRENHVEIRVENNGAPIPAHETASIFDRFAQCINSKGAGLGLSIVAEIMSIHRGSATLIQNGSVAFHLSLPMAAKQA
jgi:two-component system sensor histidine kinase TctE